LRVIRLLRFVRFLRLLRLLRILLFFWRGLDHLAQMFNVRLMRKSLLYVCISLIFGAVAFQFLEGPQEPTDQSGMVTSLWWSFTTVVTGGFADIHNPVTMGGKLLTVILVILGMVIIGIFTATLTSVMVGEDDDMEQLRVEINEHFDRLIHRIERIENQINRPDNSSD
jgi:voltage-gated potassium channel